MQQNQLLSIVITSYNNEKLNDLRALLKSIKLQTYKQIEVIYVVERGPKLFQSITDIVKKESIPSVKIIFSNEKLGLAGGRNLGIKESKGEIVAFIDDDVLLPSNWAQEMVKTYEMNDCIVGVTGPAEPLWEDRSMQWLPKEFYWLISCTAWSGLNNLEEVRSAWGMNMSFKREAFTKVGLFDPEVSGYHKPIAEDLHFSLIVRKKTGMKIMYNPKVRVKHRVYSYRFTSSFIAARSHHIGMSRYILKKFFSGIGSISSDREVNLGKKIIVNFTADTIRSLFKNPRLFIKRVSLVSLSCTCIAIGFLDGFIKYAHGSHGVTNGNPFLIKCARR